MSDHIRKLSVGLAGVKTGYNEPVRAVTEAVFSDESLAVNEREYLLKVPGVGSFYACDGRRVEYSAETMADPEWVQLYLNNQVLVALLHQRQIINFHASSFIHKGKGIMILGETGAGKSSLTVAFAMKGAGFLSDDLTPVVFRKFVPHIWSLNKKIKLRADTIGQLNISDKRLREAEAGTGKKYLHLEKGAEEFCQLDTILKIETGRVSAPVFQEPSLAEKFARLRSEICSWEILAGMRKTEEVYLQQLVQIIKQVHFIKVVRPPDIKITRLHDTVREYLEQEVKQ